MRNKEEIAPTFCSFWFLRKNKHCHNFATNRPNLLRNSTRRQQQLGCVWGGGVHVHFFLGGGDVLIVN